MVCTASGFPQISLDVSARALWRFHALLRKGFRVEEDRLPCPLERLLCDRLAIPLGYVTQRIQTVFLNGRAVDDIFAARVDDGATVALSAAMPGLVGATLRKGGRLTSLRSHISHRTNPGRDHPAAQAGQVTVKLFNLICTELAPDLLSRGILIPPGDIQAFLDDAWPDLASDCRATLVNGTPLGPGALADHIQPGTPVCLTVRTSGG